MLDKNDETEGSLGRLEKRKKRILVVWIVIASFLVLTFYRVSLNFSFFPYVMWTYMVVLTVLIVVYILYNRGFTGKGITEDMLPEDWSLDRRTDFVQNSRKRLERSKWMLVLIVAFLFTFLLDALELFVIRNLF